jgi:hypothetical protein
VSLSGVNGWTDQSVALAGARCAISGAETAAMIAAHKSASDLSDMAAEVLEQDLPAGGQIAQSDRRPDARAACDAWTEAKRELEITRPLYCPPMPISRTDHPRLDLETGWRAASRAERSLEAACPAQWCAGRETALPARHRVDGRSGLAQGAAENFLEVRAQRPRGASLPSPGCG